MYGAQRARLMNYAKKSICADGEERERKRELDAEWDEPAKRSRINNEKKISLKGSIERKSSGLNSVENFFHLLEVIV